MNILGISCFDHSSAACLIQNGKIAAAVQEERFNREKYSQKFPIESINYCLQEAQITVKDVDYIGFYERPFLKFSRVVINHVRAYPFSLPNFLYSMPQWLENRLILPLSLEKDLGYTGKTLFIKHHLSHAASAFLVSPFEEAAIITADGVGEQATLTVGQGCGTAIKINEELCYPHSLGFLYAAITAYLGFRIFSGEGKVMALAGYGKPVYADAFRKMVKMHADGSFKINSRYLTLNRGKRMHSREMEKLLGPPRIYNSPLEQRHYDIAASLQQCVEDILIRIARRAYEQTRFKNLCLAGGVFLNCVANHKILEQTPFEHVFIQPAAGDSGGALGVALYIDTAFCHNSRRQVMSHAYYGPSFSEERIRRAVINKGLKYRQLPDDLLIPFIVEQLMRNKIVGIFRGRMEFGPRALGNRSILANPACAEMKDILNKNIKGREWFRPFAPVVLEARKDEFFHLRDVSPFMLLAPRVREDKKECIPSAVHVDGTARVQTIREETNPFLWKLISAFDRLSGVPMLLNTSLNVRGEPIVNTPHEACALFENTGIDFLVLENIVLSKEDAHYA